MHVDTDRDVFSPLVHLRSPVLLAIVLLTAAAVGVFAALVGPAPPPAGVRASGEVLRGGLGTLRAERVSAGPFTTIRQPEAELTITRRWVDRNFGTRPAGITPYAIVVHATGGGEPGSGYRTLAQLRRRFNGDAEVSAHYGIDRQGRVMQYVPDQARAWHTAAAGWNDASIGIELLNSNSGREPFPQVQLRATRLLVERLAAEHAIPLEYVVRHRDVQPWDRRDPANNFPWREFVASLRAAPAGG